MGIVDIVFAVLYGAVQGITEWLPISSTAHLMLLSQLTSAPLSSDAFAFFLVAVQLASAFAVLTLYPRRLIPFLWPRGSDERSAALLLWGRMAVGCLPAAAVGFFLDDLLEDAFSSDGRMVFVIGVTLAFYGILFVVLERFFLKKKGKTCVLDSMTLRGAIGVGAFQILALLPGTSRSGSTVLGAMLLGYDRNSAAEFSFFLALPVMLGATLLRGGKLLLAGVRLSGGEVAFLLLGCAASFLVSLATLRFLIDFVRRYGFSAFGWYRIALSVVIFAFLTF